MNNLYKTQLKISTYPDKVKSYLNKIDTHPNIDISEYIDNDDSLRGIKIANYAMLSELNALKTSLAANKSIGEKLKCEINSSLNKLVSLSDGQKPGESVTLSIIQCEQLIAMLDAHMKTIDEQLNNTKLLIKSINVANKIHNGVWKQ